MTVMQFQCDQCVNSYSRKEHLKRHQRSHTLGRPYQCAVCGRSYSRKDVLNRHLLLHTNEQPLGALASRSFTGRVSQACIECSAKKIRCNGRQPCASCLGRELGDSCTYQHSSNPADLQSRLQIPNQLELDVGHTLVQLQTPDSSHMQHPHSLSQPDSLLVPREPLFVDERIQEMQQPPSPTLQFQAQSQVGHDFDSNSQLLSQGPDLLSEIIQACPSEELELPFFPDAFDLGLANSALDWLNLPENDDFLLAGMSPLNYVSRVHSRQPTRRGTPMRPEQALSSLGESEASESFWPTEWQPTTEISFKLPNVILTKAQLEMGDTMQVKPLTTEVRDNLYRALQDIAKVSYVPVDISAFPDARTLNVFLQLYFEHFHPLCPVLSRSTFDTSRNSSLVLLAILTVGAQYQSPAISLGFSELLRKATQATCERDNAMVRMMPVNQAMLLTQICGLAQGSKRTLEICESMRGHLVNHVRKSRFLEDVPLELQSQSQSQPFQQQRPHAADGTAAPDDLKQRWLDWRAKEERKRLGIAAWMSDCSFATSFNMLPMMSVAELQCGLPCDEALWDAPTEFAWKSRFLTSKFPPESPPIQSLLAKLLEEQEVEVNAWGRSILMLCLFRATWQESHFRNDPATSRRDLITRAFSRVKAPETRSAMRSQSDILFHLLQIELFAPMVDLQSLSGRRTWINGGVALQHVRQWVTRHPKSARKAVYHAACLYAQLVNMPSHGTDEPIAALNSALVIWAYVTFTKGGPLGAPSGTSGDNGQTVAQQQQQPDFFISPQQQPDESFVEHGGRVMFQGIGNAADKLPQVLRVFADCLSGMSIWLISQSYAQILRQFADTALAQGVQAGLLAVS